MRDLPHDLALVQIDRRDAAVRRLHERQAADGERPAALASRRCGSRPRCALRPSVRTRAAGGTHAGQRGPLDKVHVRRFGVSRPHQPERADVGLREHERCMRLRIVRAAWPVRATGCAGQHQRRQRSVSDAHDGRCEHRADLVLGHERQRLGVQLGCEIDQVVGRHTLTIVRRGLGRKRLRPRGSFAGHGRRGNGTLFDWPDRFPGHAIEDVKETGLARLHHRLDSFAVDGDLAQRRRTNRVVLPEIVVNHLEVPDPFSGLRVERNECI